MVDLAEVQLTIDGLEALRVIEAVKKSAATGQAISLVDAGASKRAGARQ